MSSSCKSRDLVVSYGLGKLIKFTYYTVDDGGTEVYPDISSYTIKSDIRASNDSSSSLYVSLSTDGLDPDSRIYVDPDQSSNPGVFYYYINIEDSKFDANRVWWDMVLMDGVNTPIHLMAGSYFKVIDAMTQL